MSAVPTKRIKSRGKIVYLSQGTYNGKATWHYLLVDRMKLPILLKDVQKGGVDLLNYSTILFSGFGEAPPKEVSTFVRNQYGDMKHRA